MQSNLPLQIRRGSSSAADARTAVAEIREAIRQDSAQLVLFFCAPTYDLSKLAEELQTAFPDVPVVGCTTAGQLGLEGFTKHGITALSLAGEISVRPFVVKLAAMNESVAEIAPEINALRQAMPDWHPFGLLLVDGLSRAEERLASLLYRHLPQIPIVGGSASDDLAFVQTHVYAEGRFMTDAAVFTLFHTALPSRTFRFDHFVPTDDQLIITRSDPNNRVVYEINGEPAGQVYADFIGEPVTSLNTTLFSLHPLVLEMGGKQYLRSISSANADLSLTLFCAIEDGVVLSLGRTVDPVEATRIAFERVRDELGELALVLGCDCVLRHLEFKNNGLLDSIGEVFGRNQIFGFSTYGEQLDGMHMNQTFTGVAIANSHERI